MDYRIARNANIVLGVCSVVLESIAFHDSLVYREFEKVFLGVTSLYILEAIFFVFWFSNKPKQAWEIGWRALSALVLFAFGGYLIWSTVDIQDNFCDESSWRDSRKCQHFELKLAAASLTIANGIFYLLANSKDDPLEGGVVHAHSAVPPASAFPAPGYQTQYVHSTVVPQGTIYVVPRAHLQPMSTASNYNPTLSTTGYNSSGHQYQSAYPVQHTYHQQSAFSAVRNT